MWRIEAGERKVEVLEFIEIAKAAGGRVHVVLVRRDGETVAELLLRLEAALGKTSADKTAIDEVLPEMKRGRAPKKGT